MKIEELKDRLLGSSLTDIQLTGFIDQDETPPRFRPNLQFVYLTCGSALLEFAAIGTTGTMRTSFVDGLTGGFGAEDGMVPAATSLRELVFMDPQGTHSVVELCLWSATETNDGLQCSAARLGLANDQQLFIDPTYHFGIRLGGPEQEKLWRESWPKASTARQQVFRLTR